MEQEFKVGDFVNIIKPCAPTCGTCFSYIKKNPHKITKIAEGKVYFKLESFRLDLIRPTSSVLRFIVNADGVETIVAENDNKPIRRT